MEAEWGIDSFGCADQAEKRRRRKEQRQAALTNGHRLRIKGLAHAESL
jgi:hypothetical protein